MGNFTSTAGTAFTPSDAFFLCEAIRTGSLDIVRLFLKKNPALVYATDAAEKSTPWHVAAAAGHDVIVRVLIDTTRANSLSNNFDPVSKVINKQNAKGQTPLMLACGGGHSICVRLLLESGAHLLVADVGGRSALHYASLHCRADGKGNDCAELLLDHMQRQLLAQGTAVAPLNVHANVVRKFADTGDLYGRTALHCAACSGNTRAAHALWAVGADICARTEADCYEPEMPCNNGTTPLHYAAMRGHQPMVVLLLAAWHRMTSRPGAPLPRPVYARSLLCAPIPTCTAAEPHGSLSKQPPEACWEQEREPGAPAEESAAEERSQHQRWAHQQQPIEGLGIRDFGTGATEAVAAEEEERRQKQEGEQRARDERGDGEMGGSDQDGDVSGVRVGEDAIEPLHGRKSCEGGGGAVQQQEQQQQLQQQQGKEDVGGSPEACVEASAILISSPSPSLENSAHGAGGSEVSSFQSGAGVVAALPLVVELPPPPSPRPPAMDLRVMVDAYGLTPYAIAGKRSPEHGSMLLELLDPATDFTVGDSEEEEQEEQEEGPAGPGKEPCGNGARRARRARNGYHVSAICGDEKDEDDSGSEAGPLLLWEGVELVRDVASDPEGFFKLQQTVALLQMQLPEEVAEVEEGTGRGGGRSARISVAGSISCAAASATVEGGVACTRQRISVTKDVIPDCFLCPMTCKVFRNPVVAADGVTYEREAIERHLRHVRTSPVTKKHLASKQLYDNCALRSAIEHWSTGLLPPPPLHGAGGGSGNGGDGVRRPSGTGLTERR